VDLNLNSMLLYQGVQHRILHGCGIQSKRDLVQILETKPLF